MIKLLGRKTSGNVQKVLFLLEEAGIAYEREDYGRQFENTKTDTYLSMNPTAKVPTVVDGKTVIWESNTILRYLAATKAPQLTGATPAEKTEVERWMDFLLAAINPGYLAAFKGSKLAEGERPPEFAAQVKDLHVQLAILDTHMAGKSFFALGKLTIADIALAPIVARCLAFPLDRPALPNLEAWVARITEMPAFAKATA
ncbi:MAG: glutathione S-transferase family protein [Qingshengfaniella sp.]